MKKVKFINNYFVEQTDNLIKNSCQCPLPETSIACGRYCMWFNIIVIAGVKRITCRGVEVAELVEETNGN